MTKITISVFQALTLLAEKYSAKQYLSDDNAQRKLHYVKHIYLTGARNLNHKKNLKRLLQDPILADYTVSATKQAINEDPVRRYFESHLAHNTLETSLDELDMLLLHENFHLIFPLIHEVDRDDFQSIVEEQAPHPHTFFDEYSDAIFQLNKSNSYQSLSPKTTSGRLTPEDILDDRKQKLIMIIKCMYASAWVNTQSPHSDLPLNIYNRRSYSPYNPINRGRKGRLNLNDPLDYPKQSVRPHTRGIMRSYMPLSREDTLFSEEPSNYSRPADQYTYIENRHLSSSPHSVPKRMFETQVTPFVGSISGVMLMQLKVMAILARDDELPFRAETGSNINTQLELYIKSFVAYMLYNAGGHSLDEFLEVLNFLVVQEEFKSLAGFSRITLKKLFQDTNTVAFDKAMEQTMVYNNNIIQKKYMHAELSEKHAAHAPFVPIAMNINTIEIEEGLNYSVPLSCQTKKPITERPIPAPDNSAHRLINNDDDGQPSNFIAVSRQSMFRAPVHITELPKQTPNEIINKQCTPANSTGA